MPSIAGTVVAPSLYAVVRGDERRNHGGHGRVLQELVVAEALQRDRERPARLGARSSPGRTADDLAGFQSVGGAERDGRLVLAGELVDPTSPSMPAWSFRLAADRRAGATGSRRGSRSASSARTACPAPAASAGSVTRNRAPLRRLTTFARRITDFGAGGGRCPRRWSAPAATGFILPVEAVMVSCELLEGDRRSAWSAPSASASRRRRSAGRRGRRSAGSCPARSSSSSARPGTAAGT